MELYSRIERVASLRKVRRLQVFLGCFLAVLGIGAFVFGRSVTQHVNSEEIPYDPQVVFIQSIAGYAQELGYANDLYPSVMIAQAIHESSYGQSGLSMAPYNNLFGVKGDYLGTSVSMRTWEDDGYGNAYYITAPFRAYPTYRESLQDYVAVVKQPWFSGAWRSNTGSYMDATSALTGTYATDTNYANALNYIIQLHNLTQYDYQGGSLSSQVWNSYRGRYTDAQTLQVDEAYAQQTGVVASHAEPESDGVSEDLVWNEYRSQMTTQQILDEDIAWSQMNQ